MNRKLSLTLLATFLATAALFAMNSSSASPSTNATATFGEVVGDKIKSDGLGSYEVSVTSQLTMSLSGKQRNRKVFFDFSDAETGTSAPPFGPTILGEGITANTKQQIDFSLLQVGSSAQDQFVIRFDDPVDRSILWKLRFFGEKCFGPASTEANTSLMDVTRTSANTWVISVPTTSVACLFKSEQVRGHEVLTGVGRYHMPFSLTLVKH